MSKRVREIRGPLAYPIWQRNYYEHIIRTGDEFDEISRYISENPKLWEFDEDNPDCGER